MHFSHPLSGKIFILPSFVKGSFAGCRILGWQIFFSALKIPFHSIVSNEKSAVGYIATLCVTNHFSVHAFKIFILVFDFQMCFLRRVNVFVFTGILLGVSWASYMCRWMFFIKSTVFSFYFFKPFFYPILSSEILIAHILICLILSQTFHCGQTSLFIEFCRGMGGALGQNTQMSLFLPEVQQFFKHKWILVCYMLLVNLQSAKMVVFVKFLLLESKICQSPH